MMSVFGSTGFIGKNYIRKHNGISIPRNSLESTTDILYFISTNHNYHIYDNPLLDINTNLIHLIKVLEQFKIQNNNSIFNFISSWFVYGKTEVPAKEDSMCYPTGFYSITKKCAEDLLKSYCQTFGLKYRIIRLCNIIGKDDNQVSEKKNSLQFLLKKIVNNETIKLYDDGNFSRDYLYIDDCIDAIHLIINGEKYINDIINVGSGKELIFKDLIQHAIQYTKSKSLVQCIKTPDFHKICQVKDMYLDTTKLQNLGFGEKFGVYKGIEIICNHYRNI